LDRVSKQIEETCYLAIPDKLGSLTLQVSKLCHPLGIELKPGYFEDLHCTASGKLFLSYLYPHKIEQLHASGKFVKKGPKTIVLLKDIQKEVAWIKERTFACEDEENFEGIRGIALPIFDDQDKVAGAFGVSASKYRFKLSCKMELKFMIQDTVDQLRGDLGWATALS